jgi:hypothetical protein
MVLGERKTFCGAAKCLSVTAERAEAKNWETQKSHEEFRVGLEGFLRTGEDVGMPPFSQRRIPIPQGSAPAVAGSVGPMEGYCCNRQWFADGLN